MRDYIKCIAMAGLWSIFSSIYYLGTRGEIFFSDILLYCSFSPMKIVMVNLIRLTFQMLPLFLFQVLFGTMIYRHFCVASIYYFSRRAARTHWFLKEAAKLYLLAAIYVSIIPVILTGVASIRNSMIFDRAGIILFVYFILIQSLWLFFVTIMMNLISIKLGSQNGFLITAIAQITGIALLLLWYKILPLENSDQILHNAFLLKFNPISHLIFSWHSSAILSVDLVIHQFEFSFDLNTSVILFAIFSIIALILGCVTIKRHDLILSNAETGTI